MRKTSRQELADLFRSLGIEAGDTMFVHAFLPSLGLVAGGLDTLYQELRSAVGASGHIIVPTFTASYRRNEVYDVENSASFNGALSESLRKRNGFVRSLDPLFSFAGQGPDIETLLKRESRNCFGVGSCYATLFARNTKFVGLGIDWNQGYSFMMHLERLAAVPYRAERRFDGQTRDVSGNLFDDYAIHFARDENIGWMRDRAPLCERMVEEGIVTQARLHGVAHNVFPAAATENYVVQALVNDPYCMSAGT